MYILLLSLIYLAFISLGLPDSLLGSAWPAMQDSLSVPMSYMGIISMIICGGTICSSLASEHLSFRFGTKYVTVCSVFLTAAALFGFSISNQFWMLCVWAVPYGLGAGAIDAALNNYVALYYSSRHMSWLHCFWGVGTIISPYVMSFALTHATWNTGYRMIGMIQFVIALILLCTLPIWKVNEMAEENTVGKQPIGIRASLQIQGVPTLLIGFFAYCAAENTMILWSGSYLAGARGMSKEAAAAFASLFFIGMTVGRFLSGLVSERIGDRNMIRFGTLIIVIGIFCILLPAQSNIAALAGLLIIGLGCAPVYPSIIHSTPIHFGAEKSQAIIGIQMASAYVGSTFMPPVFGFLAGHISLRILPFFLMVFFAFMTVMLETTYRKIEISLTNDIKTDII